MHSFANNIWMEITRREDIGADLKTPPAARDGGVTGSYVLVPASTTSRGLPPALLPDRD
jgi:hypothetical protein